MSGCDNQFPASVCGLEVARSLTVNTAIILEPRLDNKVLLCPTRASDLDVIKFKNVSTDGIRCIAHLSCLSCLQAIEIVDDNSDLSARLAE
jgi:hypothetical protein